MRSRTYLTALLLLALAGGVWAQNHAEEFVLTESRLQLLKGTTGTFTTLYDNPGYAYGGINDVDNRHIVFGDNSLDGFFRLDPATRQITTIVVDTTTFATPGEITIDHKGDTIVTARSASSVAGIYRIHGTTVTTIALASTLGITGYFNSGMVRDVDDGNFVIQVYFRTTSPMISVAPDGTVTTIIATTSSTGAPMRDFTQDIRTGDFYVGCLDTGSLKGTLVKVAKTGTSTLVASSNDRSMYTAVAADRCSAMAPRLAHPFYSSTSSYSALCYTDLKTYAITSLAVTGNTVLPHDVTFYRSRNIQTVSTTPGVYTLNFSFPGFGGKAYAAGLSLSGVRPGVKLMDGRTIFLNPDTLTSLTLNNALPNIFSYGPGILDANGEARGYLDVRFLPTLGFTVHLMAVVLDPQSTSNIAVIPDPWVMPL